jgi:hypothetical protein
MTLWTRHNPIHFDFVFDYQLHITHEILAYAPICHHDPRGKLLYKPCMVDTWQNSLTHENDQLATITHLNDFTLY